nr:dimethyladenosine transferase 2, mitochondrial-like isoform X1 [Rhipicephalus microplus]XP_037274035.1 dimethyladenosine transferase 2, mitochondrial-like isoform X1 [Rhipicephalus microplus]XP_037274036.1 dimethyladenosine transferase 2, mitochondrial-like isoform X1 [Rhipicephalus microplus]XP_037274037.1 dimethyladenosine transferase 2, mitochondrial-like isoform X1 [Rhipicephalus microplus]
MRLRKTMKYSSNFWLNRCQFLPISPVCGPGGLSTTTFLLGVLLLLEADMLLCGRQRVVTRLRLLQHRVLSTNPELLALCNSYPALRGRKAGQPDDLFHVHSAALDLLEEHLVHWPGGCPPVVLEANAGPGLLSRRLVEAGRITSCVRMFEHRQCFLPELRAQVAAWPTRLELVEADLLRMHNREGQLLAGITPRPWTHAPEAVLVASLSRVREVGFLRYVLHQLPMGTSLFALGRLAFLLFLSHIEAAHITASRGINFRHYRDVSILYQLFFHVDVLGQVSRELFLPARGAKTQAPLHLLRLVPRSDLWNLAGGPERLHELVFFVRQNMVRRTAYVLPCLEKWIPGCGPRLLREGATRVFERMGDLSPERMLRLFQLFSALPEYTQSAFTAAVAREGS